MLYPVLLKNIVAEQDALIIEPIAITLPSDNPR